MLTPETCEQKLALYRAGQYAFPPPPVPHWNENDEAAWIAYIDQHGRWMEPMDVAMQDARNHQRDFNLLKQ